MRTFIARDPQAITFIQEFLLPDEDYQEGKLISMLKNMLTYARDDIFLPIVIDGDKPKAFLVAIAPPGQSHTWIVQAWADPGLKDNRVKDLIFIELIMWTLSQGRRFVRGETKRETGPFLRRWGFKEFSQILDYEIGEKFEERILARQKELDKKLEKPKEASGRKTAEQIRSEAKARRDAQKPEASGQEKEKNGLNKQTGDRDNVVPEPGATTS